MLITVLFVFWGRKLENILNNLATKLHKPQLNFADRLQIALGMQHVDWTFCDHKLGFQGFLELYSPIIWFLFFSLSYLAYMFFLFVFSF